MLSKFLFAFEINTFFSTVIGNFTLLFINMVNNIKGNISKLHGYVFIVEPNRRGRKDVAF